MCVAVKLLRSITRPLVASEIDSENTLAHSAQSARCDLSDRQIWLLWRLALVRELPGIHFAVCATAANAQS